MFYKNTALFLLVISFISVLSCSDDNNPADSIPDFNLQISSNPDTLKEVEKTVAEIQLELNQLPPEEGIEIPLDVRASDGSEKPLARFEIENFNPDEDMEGAVLAEQPDLSTLNQVVLNMINQQATINLVVSNDDFDSGPLDVIFSIRESQNSLFTVNEGNASTSFTIVEGKSVAMTSSPDTLVETENTVAEINFTLSVQPDSDGLRVPMRISASDGSTKPLARFDIANFNASEDLQGATLAEQPDLETLNRLVLNITEQEASLVLTVNNDDFDAGPLDVTFTIEEIENGDFVVVEDAGSVSFTIVENN